MRLVLVHALPVNASVTPTRNSLDVAEALCQPVNRARFFAPACLTSHEALGPRCFLHDVYAG